MKVTVSPEALRRFRETISLYRTYMTKREVAERSVQVKEVLRSLKESAGHGDFEDQLEMPADGIRYRSMITGHFKVVYRVVDEVVQVSDIFDSRQDPGKM